MRARATLVSARKVAKGKIRPIVLEISATDSNAPIADTDTANNAVVSDPLVAYPAAPAITAAPLEQVTQAPEEDLEVYAKSFALTCSWVP